MRISDWSSDVCSSDLRTFHDTVPSGRTNTKGSHVRHSIPGPVEAFPDRWPTCAWYPLGPAWQTCRSVRAPVRPSERFQIGLIREIGRASCRERVCQYV